MTLKEFAGLFANKMKEVEDAQEALKEFRSLNMSVSGNTVRRKRNKMSRVKTVAMK